MARSTKRIYQAIIDEKETLSSLNGLTPNPETTQTFIDDLATQSRVAIWRLSAWVFAFMSHLQEMLWDVKEEELQAIQDETPPHTRLWWENMIKAFQFGDVTIVDSNGKVTYETIDTDKQIVVRTNVKNLVPTGAQTGDAVSVNIRVVKFEDPNYVELSAPEAAAFDNYISEIKPLGVKTNIDHNGGGLIFFGGTIWYDASILNADLTYVEDVDTSALDEVMDDYINNYAMVNSKLNENEMIDRMREHPGIIDVLITSHTWRETPISSSQNVIDAISGRKELDIDSVAASYTTGVSLITTAENVVN